MPPRCPWRAREGEAAATELGSPPVKPRRSAAHHRWGKYSRLDPAWGDTVCHPPKKNYHQPPLLRWSIGTQIYLKLNSSCTFRLAQLYKLLSSTEIAYSDFTVHCELLTVCSRSCSKSNRPCIIFWLEDVQHHLAIPFMPCCLCPTPFIHWI